MTPKQLEALITRHVNATLRPQRQEFANRRRRAVALANALAELDKGVGPATNQVYQDAARTQGALAGGFTGAIRDAASQEAASTQEALAKLNAPAAQVGNTVQAGQGAADAAYAVGGAIPGGSLAREGAAFSAAQNQLPATARGRGFYEVAAINQAEKELDDQVPKLRMDIENQLIAQEMSRSELALRQRAQAAYETNLGETIRHHKAGEKTAAQRARISDANYRLAVRNHELAVRKANQQGRKVNAAVSKRKGYLVDQMGRPIKDANGKNIPIEKDAQSKAKNGNSAKVRRDAVQEARELRGEPMDADELSRGRYVAQPGKSEFGDGSTNEPKNAKRDGDMSFDEAVGYIATQYGVSRSKARAWLVAAGWKQERKPASQTRRPGPQP